MLWVSMSRKYLQVLYLNMASVDTENNSMRLSTIHQQVKVF